MEFPIPEMTQLDDKQKAELEKLLDPDKAKVIGLFIGFPKCTRSHNAAMWAVKLGYTNVYRYPGGIKAWAGSRISRGKEVRRKRFRPPRTSMLPPPALAFRFRVGGIILAVLQLHAAYRYRSQDEMISSQGIGLDFGDNSNLQHPKGVSKELSAISGSHNAFHFKTVHELFTLGEGIEGRRRLHLSYRAGAVKDHQFNGTRPNVDSGNTSKVIHILFPADSGFHKSAHNS